MLSKEALSHFATLLTFVGYAPYVAETLRGTTKPHVFSWIIWATTTLGVFFAALEAGAGTGAWPIGVSGAITAGIAVLAYAKVRDLSPTKLDWVFFSLAMLSLLLWKLTSDPTLAVVLLAAIDLLGFGPTFRKVRDAPNSESLTFYVVFSVRNVISIFALEAFSLATLLFPVAVTLGCVALVLYVIPRRRVASAPSGNT